MDYPKIINVLAQTAAHDRVAQIHLQDIEEAGVDVVPELVHLGYGESDNDVMVNAARGSVGHLSLVIAINNAVQP